MKSKTFRVQRATHFSGVNNKHLVCDKDHVVACVCCNGNRDYSYILYDESQEERVRAFIKRLDKQRKTIYAHEFYF